jgi:regulator of sigma E protease
MSSFVPYFGNGLFTVAAFIVALSIIVTIHEYGHYIVGRWSGIKAEVFSIGFGKVLISRVDKHGTRWQIAAIPLGGYVKFKGDANAASVGGTGGARDTMLGAPLWARSATVAAGPVFNFILTVIVFIGIAFAVGVPAKPLILKTIPTLPETYVQDLQVGDRILEIDGIAVDDAEAFWAALDQVDYAPAIDYAIIRDDVQMVVQGPYPQTTTVLGVNFDSAAAEAGVREYDVITAIDGAPVWAFDQMVEIVSASDGKTLTLSIWREGAMLDIDVTPRKTDLPTADGFETRWLLGVNGGVFAEFDTETPSFGQAVTYGFAQLGYVINTSLSAMKHMITGQISTCNLSSPVGIAEASAAMAKAGLLDFIGFIGFLSAAVGLLNLFPIPVLDGGHLVFHAYEAVTGRQPSDRAMRLLVTVGLALVLTLTLFGLLNDIVLCP